MDPDRQSLLDSTAFRHRLDEEVARVGRTGGFLSLALFGVTHPTSGATIPPGALARAALRLRNGIRLGDVLAERAGRLALLMPDTPAREATRAGERLLAVVNEIATGADPLEPMVSAGVATVYGEVEGGGSALVAGAEEALREAGPGRLAKSQALQGRPRILVVDDDLTFAQTLAETISERDWDAHPCADAADALRRASDPSYSGFFIDVVLPNASGVDILSAAMKAGVRRPAVLMSGKDVEPAMILEALSLGPVLFIRKPMTTAELDSALEMFRQLMSRPDTRSRVRV